MKRYAGAWVALASLVLRLVFVGWAYARFPPVEDGFYYDTLARRIAHGYGYTWLWPDGAVTYAAHYPVGYPAILGGLYAIFGARVAVAMVGNAVLGAAATYAVYVLARHATKSFARPLLAAGVFALHPALFAYVPAVMTEGVTACVLAIAAAFASTSLERRREGARRWWAWTVAAGVTMGVATLIRPQSILLAPLLGLLGATSWRGRLASMAIVTGCALACCLPWTARNCVRMDRCALVSMNGGWNLLIGAESENGGWSQVGVPEECREVWSEPEKDVCFERAARREIASHPGAFLAKAPAKVAMTLDYFGAAPWYLYTSNPRAFGERAKMTLGAAEMITSRAVLILALIAAALAAGPCVRLRAVVAVVGVAATLLTYHASIGYLALVVAIALLGRAALARAPLVYVWTAAVILATALTHAVFFGSGRYGLVVVPFVTALALLASPRPRAAG